MPSKDTLYNGQKRICFENPSYFEKAKDLRPSLYDEKVIGLGYTLMFLIHSDEALEIEKFKRARENKIEFAYDYGNLNASYQTSSLKPYVLTVILEKIIIDLEDEVENQSENDCKVGEKECDNVKNPKICLWIIDSGCSKHMTGNRDVLTIFVEKFLITVCFGNNDFAVIAGYGDVVIGSMTIKIVYYVEGLPKMKFEKDHLCSACEQGKIHRKHHKSKTAFASNKPLYLLHMDLCGPMRVESINGKRYVLVVVDDYSRYTWVFFFHSKDEASEDIGVFVGYSKESAAFRIYNKRTRKIHESVNVNFDEISEMASKQFSLEPDLSNLNETGKSSNPSVHKFQKH
nr:spindle assembly checkpoint component MAD1-like [Tanacetum cinerariifolium]